MKLFYLVYFSTEKRDDDQLEDMLLDLAIEGGEFKSCKFINVK